jgi:hypothetical protein
MEPKVTVDRLLASVTLLQIMATGRGPKPCKLSSATGFFFEYNRNRFLVTNLHAVISESEGQYPDHFVIQLHTSKTDVSQIREVRLELYDARGERKWLQHQKRSVDLAAINITDLLRDTDVLLSWTPEQLLPKGAKLGLGSEVLVVGYPMEFYDTRNNLPIVRTGTLASAYGMDFRGNPVCIVDANLEQGTSGSPVIVRPSSLLGLPIDQLNDKKTTYPGYMVGVNSGEYSALSLGLYKVWYANLILDILS